MQRDDLLPFSFGGNKVRIAECYFRDMVNKGRDAIITYGSTKSNLNRVIANMSKVYDVPCFVVSSIDEPQNKIETFNSRVIKKFNIHQVFCKKNDVSTTIESVMNQCLKSNLTPYYIYGDKYGKGNGAIATHAYVDAYQGILNFEESNSIVFDYIFLASGTGTTQSGLICGSILKEQKRNIIGISIARKSMVGTKSILSNVNQYLNNAVRKNAVVFEDKYICDGYGFYNKEIELIIEEVLCADGIPLDTTYTGKAFWGMNEYIKEKKIENAKILFIHTGGIPNFFEDLSRIKY